MRAVCLIMLIFLVGFSFGNETLFDSAVELTQKKEYSLNEFCKNYIDDIDIEKFIKKEIEADYVVVSLDECIDVALKNNFNIEIKNHSYKSSKYDYRYALTNFLPIITTFSYISDYSGQILVGGVLRDNFHETALSANVTVQHNLFEGGKQIFEAKAKKYFLKNAKHNFNYTKSQTIYLVVQYYYEMLLAKINIEIYLRNLIERNAQLKLANNLEHSGFGTKFDVIRSKNESALARSNLLMALNNFRLSQSRLANLMGIDIETHLMPFEDEVEIMNLISLDTSIEELFNSACENR